MVRGKADDDISRACAQPRQSDAKRQRSGGRSADMKQAHSTCRTEAQLKIRAGHIDHAAVLVTNAEDQPSFDYITGTCGDFDQIKADAGGHSLCITLREDN